MPATSPVPTITSYARPARKTLERAVARRRRSAILLVEDDRDMRDLLATTLRRDGYDVAECANGDDALDWLGPGVLEGELERLPAAIITDVRLPYFSGLEILESVRWAREPIPVIMITGFPDQDIYEQAFELGARSVLAKPFRLDDLRGALWTALQPSERPPRRVRPR
jgi:DNA-binding response OmpR family regulator